ncbi:Sanguinarine reductase [Actinidia chinensis var. chinensis]|uniref:Sanguinarine reductase n=1 Tax=Actinidia chinensis var. chinensis TaxID=1590841 RepID=A0A2R6R0D7_ACTCC|nr:Sanguinarine reductase [Actinidia chinensis var. chinensis]
MAAGSLSSTFSLYTSSFVSFTKSAPIPFNVQKRSLVCLSSKNRPNLVDQILDYIEGGPKLRKWYGAADLLPKDGSILEEDDESPVEDEVRDAVLVTDGDNEIGQMVILSLIVKRTRVKALVKDKRAAVEAFGTYVEPMAGDTSDRSFQQKALRGVRAIICPNEGFLSQVESLKGVQNVILLSQLSVYKGTVGIQALMNSKARKLAEQDESIVMASGIPYTIIRAGSLQNTPGGKQGFSFKEGSASQGSLSKEDAAFICVEALDAVPQKGLIFEVVNGEEKVSNWKECFAVLMEKSK